MRFVERAPVRPHHCAVIPHLGANHKDGYIDSGNEMSCIDPHIYVSVVAVREMARLIGDPSREEFEAATARVAQLEEELAAAKDALDSAERFIEAIDAIESRDFRARKKPGRPRKNESEVTADAA